MKDYYEILGVEEEASEEEIRARWIELTKRYHPDLGETEEGDERIREINEAYETLKDEPSRFQYDFERDLKRSFIKKAHRQQERRMNIRKIVLIPSLGILVLFLVIGFAILRSGRVPTPPKAEVLPKRDQVAEERTASRTPPVRIDSIAEGKGKAPEKIKEAVVPPESKKEARPPEIKEMASRSPLRSPAAVERDLEQKEDLPRKILPESKEPASAPLSPPAEKESKAKEKLAPQVVMKSDIPVIKEVSTEVPKETPKLAVKEIQREVSKEAPKPVPKEIPKEVPKEVPKKVAEEIPKEVPKEIPKQVAKETPKEASKQVAKEAVKEVPKELPKEVSKEVVREVPKEVPREVSKEVAKEAPKEVAKETPKQVAKEIPKEVPKEIPKEAPKEVAKEVSKEAPKPVPKEVPREVSKGVPKEAPKEVVKETQKQVAKEIAKEVPKEPPKEAMRVTLHPGESLTMWTRGERVVSSRPSLLAKEGEVKQFFSNYVDRYNRKDVGGFLSFFSSKAVQNQTEGLETIGSLYAKLIEQSEELRYQIEGMKIEISPTRVDVKARFKVDQRLKGNGEEKTWKGNIRWVLVKEGGRLKISSLDYQNEKFP